jgi:CelD/BcsL family acetyltransferase involved in cellulose biosynthesis
MLSFLDLDDRAIAFEYGWLSKGVYHSLKVGFDEAYARLSPGQLLRCLMLKRFFAEGEVSIVDYLGPLSDATGKWATRAYPVSRLIMANGAVGRLVLNLSRFKRREANTCVAPNDGEELPFGLAAPLRSR